MDPLAFKLVFSCWEMIPCSLSSSVAPPGNTAGACFHLSLSRVPRGTRRDLTVAPLDRPTDRPTSTVCQTDVSCSALVLLDVKPDLCRGWSIHPSIRRIVSKKEGWCGREVSSQQGYFECKVSLSNFKRERSMWNCFIILGAIRRRVESCRRSLVS